MTRRVWEAEVSVSETLVRELLAAQFPELALRSVRHLAEGWDNAVWLVDGIWAFRFPRRRVAVPLVRRELDLLPRLGPLLPLPIPVPAFIGRPTDAYPWPFVGARLLPGRELADAGVPDHDRAPMAAQLGAFLRRLHDPALARELGAGLPADPNRRADMAFRVPRARAALDDLEAAVPGSVPAGCRALLERAAELAPPGASVLVHGDLHVRHVLVADDGGVAGVIDWGDACLADPSVDLQIAWSAFDGASRRAFLDAYGPVSGETQLRAQAIATFLSAGLAGYARHHGNAALEREALAGLGRVLAR